MSLSTRIFRRLAATLSPQSEHVNSVPHIPFAVPLPTTARPDLRQKKIRRTLPSVLMRSGTSKGLFLHRNHLPASQSEWGPIILSAMGSRHGDKRQLDGVGGATSTTSKVAIVSKSTRPGIDVDYTFCQVAVGEGKLDMSGNCGNIAAGVAPFALDEGLVKARPGQKELDVRVFNTNTRQLMVETVEVGPDGKFHEEGDYRISGFKGSGSRIKIAFIEPAGSATGKLFPTGQRKDRLRIASTDAFPEFEVEATLIDSANPFVLVDLATLPDHYHALGPDAPSSLSIVEAIRREGAVRMGLAKTVEEAGKVRGIPKIALLSPAPLPEANPLKTPPTGISVTAYSMGKPHPSFQLTGAVTLAAATCIRGTVASDLSLSPYALPWQTRQTVLQEDLRLAGSKKEVCIHHRSGEILAEVNIEDDGSQAMVKDATVFRTAQRLFEGGVIVRP
ncbi:DUF453-domain-containing protein [Xylona heveae TC161]|uniref:DUF453-domain-containing protein n=1 Tax=Xylona heveae (strain CBS 132557 / TC161) TaxID=1328760 RepID=A0A165H7J1_XYLHT|nr:DUF453-domain-containing protein [Xylona heveae TC161]KZF23093.1 DUF453-domain-containing protein [Xylona heveae TC161]